MMKNENRMDSNLILTNANIITLKHLRPIYGSILIRNGKISGITDNWHSNKFLERTARVIDCRGKTILPGFIDAHLHLLHMAENFISLNIGPQNGIKSISDIQARISRLCHELKPGIWIRAKGYNEFYLKERRHLTKDDLDQVAHEHPVKLTHRTGHAHVLNSLALKLTGISIATPDPPGGFVDRAIPGGEPTGLFFEMGHLLSKLIPPVNAKELETGIKKANQQLVSLGITSFQDASVHNDLERWMMLQDWKKRGILIPKVRMMIGIDAFLDQGIQAFTDYPDQNQLKITGVKIILDETTGGLYPSRSELNKMVSMVHNTGLQVAIHAIEERAIEAACDAIEFALQNNYKRNHRHRIEHCSVCPPALADRIASLGIFVVSQPSFIYYNGDRYLATVSEDQSEHLYPLGRLLKKGINVVASSDCPIVPANPLTGIYAACSRLTETGKQLLPDQGVTLMEALKMYTKNAAMAIFEERIKGTIAMGMDADLIVLNENLSKFPAHKIKDLKVSMTIIAGQIAEETDSPLTKLP